MEKMNAGAIITTLSICNCEGFTGRDRNANKSILFLPLQQKILHRCNHGVKRNRIFKRPLIVNIFSAYLIIRLAVSKQK